MEQKNDKKNFGCSLTMCIVIAIFGFMLFKGYELHKQPFFYEFFVVTYSEQHGTKKIKKHIKLKYDKNHVKYFELDSTSMYHPLMFRFEPKNLSYYQDKNLRCYYVDSITKNSISLGSIRPENMTNYEINFQIPLIKGTHILYIDQELNDMQETTSLDSIYFKIK